MENIILRTKQLSKSFSSGGKQQHVLKNLNIEIYDGDFTIIMGASGSGKTTLLYALSGMDKPTLGEIYFGDENITGYGQDKLALFRRKNCGFVFQQNYLLDSMSVLDNCLSAGLLVNKDRKSVVRYAKELLTKVGLTEVDWNKFPTQLSGGEAQRCAVIRGIVNQPKILFADEPTGALNSVSGNSVMNLLTELNQKKQSIIMVTHDIKSARRGNRILYLRDGAICGECNLGKYDGTKNTERNEKLDSFLKEMGW